MIRAILIAALLALPLPAQAGRTIELWYGSGGDVHVHLTRAKMWKRNGDRLVIRDMQVSADALAILEARRLGVPMCHGKPGFNARPMLMLHQTKIASGSRWVFRDDAARYGFPSPVNGYRKVSMQQLGIKPCGQYKAEKKIKPSPQIWRLR
jgi:hypothetical protein